MAGYLKEKDPNHLVTVGLEGFWGAHAWEAKDFNPLPGENGQLSWTSLTGQNFTAQHDSPHIDFCGAHYWPDLWVSALSRSPMRLIPMSFRGRDASGLPQNIDLLAGLAPRAGCMSSHGSSPC